MNSSRDSYRVPLKKADVIIRVRKLVPEEAKDTLNTLIIKLLKSDKPVTISTYKTVLLKELLLDDTILKAELKKRLNLDNDEYTDIMYEGITTYFPEWGLDNVCGIANRLLQIHGEKTKVLEVLKNLKTVEGMVPNPLADQEEDNIIPIVTLGDLKILERTLKKHVIGQDTAIEAIVNNLKLKAAGLKEFIALAFNGPSGRGKTFIAQLLGEAYSNKFWKVPCASYGDEKSQKASLMGAPPGYVNGQEDSVFKQKADKGNDWVILFDEVDKAPLKLFDFFLEMLDDGTVTDSKGHKCDFSNSIFLFSSNEGYVDLRLGEGRGVGFSKKASSTITLDNSKEEIEEELRKKWPNEFIGRLDDIILFNPLTKDDIKEIAKLELQYLPVQQTNELVDYIATNGFDERYGARGLKNYIDKNLSPRIADAILECRSPRVGLYLTEIKNNKINVIDTVKKGEEVNASAITNSTLETLGS